MIRPVHTPTITRPTFKALSLPVHDAQGNLQTPSQLQTVPDVTKTNIYTFREQDFYQFPNVPSAQDRRIDFTHIYPSWVRQQLKVPAEDTRERRDNVYNCSMCFKAADAKGCAAACYNRYVQRFIPMEQRIELRDVAGKGTGAFLAQGGNYRIAVGTKVGIYFGRLIPHKLNKVWGPSNYTLPASGVQTRGALIIDSAQEGNWTRFINSSCEPNLEVCPAQAGKVRLMVFEAVQEIREGDELTMFYGRDYFTSRPEMDCVCSSHPNPYPTINDKPDPMARLPIGGGAARPRKRKRREYEDRAYAPSKWVRLNPQSHKMDLRR